jgi:hypothetical protein
MQVIAVIRWIRAFPSRSRVVAQKPLR